MPTKTELRRFKNRLIAILAAITVFNTTYAMVLPAISMDSETTAQEPGIELAQPVAEVPVETAVPAPVAAEIFAAEPVAAEPVATEPVVWEPAAVETAPAETVVLEEDIPAASPEETPIVTPEPAAVEDTDTVQEDKTAEPVVEENGIAEEEAAIEDPASEEDAEEETEEEEEENKLAECPLVYDGSDFVARVSFGPEAALPEGTMLIISEYSVDSNDYLVYKGQLFEKLKENGVAEENLEEAVAALRLFGVDFKDKDGVRILPAAAVDVEFEYKDAAQAVTDETLYAVTFRTDDNQPTKAALVSGNANGRAAVEAPYGFIQKLYVQAWQAQDYHTNPVIGQLMLKMNENSAEAKTKETEKDTDLITYSSGPIIKNVPVEGAAYSLEVQYTEEAGIPEDAEFVAIPVSEDHTDYEEYKDRALSAVDETSGNTKPTILGLFDLTIYAADGSVVEPLASIMVKAHIGNALAEMEDVYAVHFVDSSITENVTDTAPAASAEMEVIATESTEDGAASFETEGLSVFVIVGVTIEKNVLASDGHNYKVSVTYGPEAGIPEDADLSVEEILPSEEPEDGKTDRYQEYASMVGEILGWEDVSAPYLRLFDIKIVDKDDHSIKYQPMEGSTVDVNIRLADAESDSLKVVHFADGTEDGNVVETTTQKTEDGKAVSFAADGFSIYAITDEPGENARIGYRFWYNDGTQNILLSTQYFRYKDVHPAEGTPLTINEPSIPNVDSTTWNRIFRGWSKTTYNDDDSNLLTVETLNTELSGLADSDYSEGTFVDLYANLKDVYYVTYVDINPNNILATEIVPKAETGDTTFNIKGSELRPTIDSDTVLQGWYDIHNPETVYSPGQENVVVNENITLYPKIEGGSWLIFDDNDLVWDENKQEYISGGASFTPPVFYLNEVTQQPADDPVWAGYEFGGWYTDRECTTPFVFGGNLSHDTTVFAKWIPSSSQCRVIIWKQRTSDSADAADAEKTYDYVTSYLDTDVVTGQTVTLDASYKNIYGNNGTSTDPDKAYFIYNASRTDQSVVVKADGTSVLNVYYDRKPVTLSFYIWDYGYNVATNNNGTQYGLVDGQYVQLTRSGNNPNYTWTYVTGTEYIYTRYTGTSQGNYYIPDGNGGYTSVYLYRNNGRWYRTRSWSLFGGYSYSDEYNGDVFTRTEQNVTATYTGTRYTRNNNRSWQLYKSFTGLYNSTLEENGYTWPAEYDWYENGGNNGSTSGTRTTFMSAFLPTDVDISGSSITVNFYGDNPSGSYHIHFMTQNLDGTYSERDNVAASGRNFYISDKYNGYHAVRYKADNGPEQSVGNKGTNGYYNNGNTVSFNNNLYIYFDLNPHILTFYTNNAANQLIDKTVSYSQPLSDYENQSPGQRDGYYFLGWFADPGCSEPFDFSQTMPDNNIAVYGKWRMQRFRIVIEPGANNVYMGSQATRFRLDYDERIDGGLLESAARAGYILDGWYTDPEFTNRFLFSSPVNTNTPGVDMTYHDSPSWAAARAAYGDDTEAYDNVRGILHLYAKWIPDTNSMGINVVYDPGDAAIYDSLGALLTTVPIDTHMYGFDGTSTAREAPSNYNDLYTFKYWEATTEDGETVHFYPGDPITLADLAFTNPIYDESTGELLRKTVTLRAVYDQTGDPSRMTHITYDGNTFTADQYSGSQTVLQGETRDGTHRYSVTLDEEINQTITLPSAEDFYLEGWELVGWSFTEGTYAEQVAAATDEAPNFEPGQRVAADNLVISDLNNEGNTLYAMWQPKEYTVTVRQVIEDGVPSNSFDYIYKRGVEANIDSETDHVQTLIGSNSSFTEEHFGYYNRVGDVIRITTPTPADETYDVRVIAVVTKDDGTTEILNPTAAGDYRILGDVVITYTYSLKVPVKLQKRDATDHTAVLTGAEFVVTPVEYNSSTQRWENAGTGQTIIINAAMIEQYLQEGTYRITEINAPENYAKVKDDLYLTVKKDESFTLFTASGGTVSSSIAELDNTGTVLTVYDNPIRTVKLTKKIEGTGQQTETFSFKVTIFNSSGTRLAGYTIGEQGENALTTNNIGEVSLSLGDQESVDLNIPHGSKITVVETQNSLYQASYKWNDAEETESNVFGSEPVEITADSALTFTNRRAFQKIRIKKIGDDAPDGLAGAEFSLTADQGTTIPGFTDMTGLQSLAATPTASNLGFLPGNDSTDTTLFVLPIGTYTLTETEEPEYYAGLTGAVTLTVSLDGITEAETEDGDRSLISMSDPDPQGIYTLTVKNTHKKATVKVIKNVKGVTTDQKIGFNFTVTGLTENADSFQLYGTYAAADGSEPEHLHEKEYTEIPFGKKFIVTEEDTPADFSTEINIQYADNTTVTLTEPGTGELTVNGDITVTYTNTRYKIPLKVVKTDQSNVPLAGATFTGDLIEGSVTTQITGTGENAEAIIINENAVSVKPDDQPYIITETNPPPGYNMPAGSIKIWVKEDPVSTSGDILVEVKINDEVSSFASAKRVDVDHPELGWIVTIKNNAGVALPNTGGFGTHVFYVLGSLLVTLAGGILLMRRRRRMTYSS